MFSGCLSVCQSLLVRCLIHRQGGGGISPNLQLWCTWGHYARISTDPCYQPPKHKLTTAGRTDTAELITEFRMFEILDKLCNTATGMDLLPAWFLRLGAPVFCGPLARLFNKSVASSTVPKQWKLASITPVPKTATPQEHADFRPISITPVLSRTFERVICLLYTSPSPRD